MTKDIEALAVECGLLPRKPLHPLYEKIEYENKLVALQAFAKALQGDGEVVATRSWNEFTAKFDYDVEADNAEPLYLHPQLSNVETNPVGEVVSHGKTALTDRCYFHKKTPIGTKLYTSPPNTQAKLDKAVETLQAVKDWGGMPEYHDQAMGCGLEDRDIYDRYDAMAYGWEKAIAKVDEWVISLADEALKEIGSE